MNKYSFLAAMALVAMASCTNNEFEQEGPAVAASETPIVVKTGVATKASIGTGDNVTALFALISAESAPEASDWEAFSPRTENKLADGTFANYATDAANLSTGSFVANPTAQAISFQPTLYYNGTQDNNDKAYMVGVAPVGTVSGGTVTFATKDGEQDILYAEQIDKGSKDSPDESATFKFEHMTGQVSFKVKKDETTLASSLVTVKGITLKQVRLPKSIALGDGKVTYDAQADLALPNVISSQAVTEAGVETGNPVMVAPMVTLSIDAVITIDGKDKTYSNVPVTFTGTNGGTGITQGYSSEVTINVKQTTSTETEIEASASVAPWKTGNTGNVDLN